MTNEDITDQDIDNAAVLEAAGIDLEALQQRRAIAGLRLLGVMTAARAVSENIGTPGAAARRNELLDALEALAAADPTSAVLVAAAVWSDRYGSSGAPDRLVNLQDAVESMRGDAVIVEPTPEEAEYHAAVIGECTCQPDHKHDAETASAIEVLFAAVERPYDNPELEPGRPCGAECGCKHTAEERAVLDDPSEIASFQAARAAGSDGTTLA